MLFMCCAICPGAYSGKAQKKALMLAHCEACLVEKCLAGFVGAPHKASFQIPRLQRCRHRCRRQAQPEVKPDDLADPFRTPPPTHPGIKYVARALTAILHTSDDLAEDVAEYLIGYVGDGRTLTFVIYRCLSPRVLPIAGSHELRCNC